MKKSNSHNIDDITNNDSDTIISPNSCQTYHINTNHTNHSHSRNTKCLKKHQGNGSNKNTTETVIIIAVVKVVNNDEGHISNYVSVIIKSITKSM